MVFFRITTKHLNDICHDWLNVSEPRSVNKTQNIDYIDAEYMLRLVVLLVLCCSNSLLMYGPFCHGALKLKHLFNL